MNFLVPIAITVFLLWVLRLMAPGYFYRLGAAYEDRGDFDNAERMFFLVLRIESWIGQFIRRNRGLAIAYESLGTLYKHKGLLKAAVEMLLKAIEIYDQMG